MTYNQKRELLKNMIYVSFILLIAVVSTYYIYYKFQGNREVDESSESLDIVYHENSGDQLSLKKVTPVTDSVGLSSKSYTVSVKNNLTEDVNYKVRILDDLEAVENDECGEFLIPKEDIRVSVKVNREDNEIYNLDELEDGIILYNQVGALDEDTISVRLWVRQDSALPMGAHMHYHGILRIIEDNSTDSRVKG